MYPLSPHLIDQDANVLLEQACLSNMSNMLAPLPFHANGLALPLSLPLLSIPSQYSGNLICIYPSLVTTTLLRSHTQACGVFTCDPKRPSEALQAHAYPQALCPYSQCNDPRKSASHICAIPEGLITHLHISHNQSNWGITISPT